MSLHLFVCLSFLLWFKCSVSRQVLHRIDYCLLFWLPFSLCSLLLAVKLFKGSIRMCFLDGIKKMKVYSNFNCNWVQGIPLNLNEIENFMDSGFKNGNWFNVQIYIKLCIKSLWTEQSGCCLKQINDLLILTYACTSRISDQIDQSRQTLE